MRPLLTTACAALLLVGAGCSSVPVDGGGGGASAGTFPETPLATLMSKSGGLAVAVRTAPAQPPSRGVVSVEYTITAGGTAGSTPAGAPQDGLVLDVVPWMPDMGHGASTQPSVSAEGEGRYLITDVDLFMPGRWELRTQIGGPAGDSVAPLFEIP